MKPCRIIFSGGGTGGHIFPAIAIANAVKKAQPETEILFVGALGRMEMEKVPASGYPIEGIPIAGFQRSFSLSNLKLPFLILKSLFITRAILKKFKPHVVVGTGGYASGPLLRSASKMGIPILIQEQNSYAGITNKLLAKSAAKICVAYDGMDRYFPAEKLLLLGNPVRQEVLNIEGKREEAIAYFQLDTAKKTVLVLGGSLGAKAINEAIGNGQAELLKQGIQVLWQCGKTYHAIALEQSKEFESKGVRVQAFINRMDLAYAVADVVISRAGAGAISELCLVQKPCILVPLPSAAEDHQTKNALALVNKEAALLVKDKDCGTRLVAYVLALLANTDIREKFRKNMSALAFRNSAEIIAGEVLKLAKQV
ncbi:MAG TPA: undecaprenyldiphospho-muramoylpentapeptide beta-N-acetylglucosaminyltransferase [Bacteroidia bacterium]|nr:undecaprenyldiphospho-muramoylpentapeptide beta-N-acetylglucosaminyltransferase [Bacteroidia bacterium]